MKPDSKNTKHLQDKMNESEPVKTVIIKKGPSKKTRKEAEKELSG
jgi:hypothetical protein